MRQPSDRIHRHFVRNGTSAQRQRSRTIRTLVKTVKASIGGLTVRL